MLGSKANKDSPQLDTFDCLRFGTTITFVPPPKDFKPDR